MLLDPIAEFYAPNTTPFSPPTTPLLEHRRSPKDDSQLEVKFRLDSQHKQLDGSARVG